MLGGEEDRAVGLDGGGGLQGRPGAPGQGVPARGPAPRGEGAGALPPADGRPAGRLGPVDHEVFLRERAKRSGRDGPPHVPGKRADEVAQHEDWHEKLLLLEEKKREVRPCARVFLRSSV